MNKLYLFFIKYKFIILAGLLLILSIFVFDVFWINLISEYWVEPVMSKLYSHELIVFLLLTTFFVVYYLSTFNLSRKLSKIKLGVYFFYSIIYLICFFSCQWKYSLIIDNYLITAWTHLTLLPWFLEIALFIKLNKNKKLKLPILEKESTRDVFDSYGRNNLVKTSVEVLKNCFYNNGSFVVSVKGDWGTGKTTFLNKILDEYKNVSDEYLIIFFEPWKCDSADNIVKTFFTLLKDKLNPYIPSISHEINNYLDFLSPVVENHFIKLLKQYCNSLNGIKYNAYDKLSVTLESAKIPTIVFVDDIDRLNADEILEVLKLVRNTANLPYIQFIVAYDFKYICETLNENSIKNPSKYIEKFFDVDLPLPSFEDSVISGELFKRIEPIFKEIWPEDIAYIKQLIYLVIEGADISKKHITYIVSNMRDVIRFSNSFKLLAKLYFDNDLHKRIKGNHLFLLELIRYKYFTIYEILRTNPLYLLQFQSKNTYILNEFYESRIREVTGEKEYETNLLLYIIRILFVNESENAIRNIRNYSNYFMYREDSRFLKKYEIFYLLTLADNEMIVSAEQMYKEKYPREFYNVLKGLLETSQGENTIIEIIELYRLIFILLRTNEDSMRSELINLYISHLAVTQLDVYEIVEDYFQKQIDIRVFDLQIDIILLIPENYFDTKKLYNYILRWLQIKSIKERTLDFKENSESYKNTFLKFLSFKGNILNKSDALNQIISSFYEETEETLILDLEQLINVLKEYFIGFEKKLSDTGFKLYNNCAEIVAKYGGVDYQYIATEIKEAIKIEINKNPDIFFETLIVKESNNGRNLQLENFYNNVFENKDEIETFILSHQESKYYELVRNFWNLYKTNNFNNITYFADTDIDALCDENLKTSVEQIGRMHHMLDMLKDENLSEYKIKEMQDELRTFSLRINIRKELEKEIKVRLKKNIRE